MTPEQTKRFKYWQTRTIIATMVGYALFYFVRKNFSLAMPGLEADLGISKTSLGIFLTLNGVVYGLSRFVNGILADRMNARWYMAIGLALCALANFAFGFGEDVSYWITGQHDGSQFTNTMILFMGIMWVINGILQGTGFPPCARLLTHWIPPTELATKMSIWNMSHSIGAGLIFVLGALLVHHFDNSAWRLCFLVPAVISLIGAGALYLTLRDKPSSVGLPELETQAAPPAVGEKKETTSDSAYHKAFLRRKVFLNPTIWIIAVGNFFVYIVRFAVLDWGPTMLKEHLHMDISHAGWTVAAFEIAGIAGMLAAGWATDRFFGGRAPRTCVICMLMTALCLVGLYTLNEHTPLAVAIAILMSAGFFIYGPQALVGIAAANIATKRAAATAGGFCGLFGYGSTIVSGWGMGMLVQYTDWSVALYTLVGMALVGTAVFAAAWKAKPNGYDD